jgi:hypothetical protein
MFRSNTGIARLKFSSELFKNVSKADTHLPAMWRPTEKAGAWEIGGAGKKVSSGPVLTGGKDGRVQKD